MKSPPIKANHVFAMPNVTRQAKPVFATASSAIDARPDAHRTHNASRIQKPQMNPTLSYAAQTADARQTLSSRHGAFPMPLSIPTEPKR